MQITQTGLIDKETEGEKARARARERDCPSDLLKSGTCSRHDDAFSNLRLKSRMLSCGGPRGRSILTRAERLAEANSICREVPRPRDTR